MSYRLHSRKLQIVFWMMIWPSISMASGTTHDNLYVHAPLHTLIESSGALFALALAALLYVSEKNRNSSWLMPGISGLISIGILDAFHAASLIGNAFVWLHIWAVLLGGIFFATVYLPDNFIPGHKRYLPIIALILSTAIGMSSWIFPEGVPSMAKDNQFIPGAIWVNLAGGMFFLAAAFRFNQLARKTARTENRLFSLMTLIFATAAFFFPFSSLWSTSWWAWHLIRLAAYLVALRYLVLTLISVYQTLREREALLTNVLDNLDDGIITMDERSVIVSCNPSAESMFGYGKAELIGKPVSTLFSPPFFQTTGRRKDGSLFPTHVDLSEVTIENHHLFVLDISDITEQKLALERLEQKANHDAMTGLPNRNLFLDRLSQAIAHAHRHQHLAAVIFIDLDHFKEVNDTLGHGAGDYLLKEVANRLVDCVREGDTVSRLGGDEFAIIVTHVSLLEDCAMIAEKILASISRTMTYGDRIMQISASVGIGIYPIHGIEGVSLLNKADIAMYQSKFAGKNSYHIYPITDDVKAVAGN